MTTLAWIVLAVSTAAGVAVMALLPTDRFGPPERPDDETPGSS